MTHPSVIRPRDHAVYAGDKMGKAAIFESARLLVGLNAFEPGQEHQLHAHAGQDKVYHVLEGEGLFLLEGGALAMTAGDLLVAPAGVPHGVRNTGPGRLLVLAVLAPGPSAAVTMARNLEDQATSGVARWASVALLAGLAVWTWSFARTPLSADAMDSFLHLPDLVFHEAGHVIFLPFGQFMTVLGGSLMQVLVPVILAAAFVRQHQPFSAAVCAWWAGQNLVDLAPYIADARALQLVLLGGQTGAEVEGHDWEFILSQLGALHHDRALGLAAHYGGLLLMIAAIAFGAWTLYRTGRRSSALPSAV